MSYAEQLAQLSISPSAHLLFMGFLWLTWQLGEVRKEQKVAREDITELQFAAGIRRDPVHLKSRG